jgi:hypothetical protein
VVECTKEGREVAQSARQSKAVKQPMTGGERVNAAADGQYRRRDAKGWICLPAYTVVVVHGQQ